ncbi:TonB-dependent receptor plug domain-containing protein [Candidatus Poribacteria bacterium]
MLSLTIRAEDSSKDAGSDVVELDEIVVSATRTPATLDSISASSSIVSEKQIQSSTATDLGHLLEKTNLLDILNYGPGGISTASIRGSSREQVLVLVDGERINDSLSGSVDLDTIPIAYAKRIEVVRGGQSAMYGADAVGGIINIITKQPTGTKARAWSTLGAYDSLSMGAEASRRVKTVSGILSLSRTTSESDFLFEDKFGRELVRENADSKKRSVFGKLTWDISDSAILRLSGDHYYSDKGAPGPIGQFTPEANQKDRSIGFKADLEHSPKEGILYKLSGYKRDTKLRYVSPQGPFPIDDIHKADAMGTELQVNLFQNTSIPLIWGLSFRNDDIASTAVGDQRRETYSAYIQQELGRDFGNSALSLSRIVIFPAVRWDHYSDFDAGASPKLGVLASFGQFRVVTVKANVGRSYRAPSMNDLYWPPDPFAFGNPDLEPERATNMDAGLHFHVSEPSLLSQLSMIRLGATYFRNSFRDRIQWTPGADGKWSPQNLSEALTTGLETEMQAGISLWNMPDLVNVTTSYTFLKAEDMQGRQLIYRPKHALGYALRVGADGLWSQIQGVYRSRRYFTVQNTKWLDPFMSYDLQLGIERRSWSNTKIGLIFEIKNLFDTEYQHVADYPLPGREWSIRTSIGMEGK